LYDGTKLWEADTAETILTAMRTGIKPLKFDLEKLNISPDNTLRTCNNQILRHNFTITHESMFSNVTKSVLVQRNTNLCVPISTCDLFYAALKLIMEELHLKLYKYTLNVEQLLSCLTMRLTPRSLHEWSQYGAVGDVDTSNQLSKAERVLKRIVHPTFFEIEGWKILLRESDQILYNDLISKATRTELKLTEGNKIMIF